MDHEFVTKVPCTTSINGWICLRISKDNIAILWNDDGICVAAIFVELEDDLFYRIIGDDEVGIFDLRTKVYIGGNIDLQIANQYDIINQQSFNEGLKTNVGNDRRIKNEF